MWWCLGCWEPLTWAGVNDRQGFLVDNAERHRELSDRYGLRPREFYDIMKDPGSMANPLHFVPLMRDERAEPKLRPPWRTKTGSTPALAAVSWQPVGAPAGSADCRHLTNEKIRRLTKAAQQQNYKSHTDRYRKDGQYKAQCQNRVPTTPEFLQYETGVWAREDGEDDILEPVHRH